MRFASHRLAVIFGLGVALQGATADAIVVARVTRRGYIVVDDDGVYGDTLPTSGRALGTFISDTTVALTNLDGFHEGRYLAAMQIPMGGGGAVAFYLPIRNDVRGIGQHSGVDSRSEVFDNNSSYGTAFSLDGFVYLNSYRFFTDPRAMIYGRFILCTQEFGHRYGATLSVPPFPVGGRDAGGDADVTDASDDASDATFADVMTDATRADVASTDAGADVRTDASMDARVDTGPAPLTRDALLGRGNVTDGGVIVNRAHWNYFFNTGGSPMEGNNWNEFEPGMFRTDRPTFRFAPLDLYDMGLIPPSEVPPTYLITDTQNVPRGAGRDSPPEYNSRVVTVRGRRVDISIDDIVRANGVRTPAYPSATRDLDVVWVLLATPDDVSDELAAEFDQAIDSCSAGYAFATAERGHLVTTPPPGSDAGMETPDVDTPDVATSDVATSDVAAPDASRRDVPFDPDVPNIPPPDGMTVPGDAAVAAPPLDVHAGGGCACSATGTTRDPHASWLALAAAASMLRRRARRRMSAHVASPKR